MQFSVPRAGEIWAAYFTPPGIGIIGRVLVYGLCHPRYRAGDRAACPVCSKYKVGHEAEYIGFVVEVRLDVDEGRAVIKGFRVVYLSLKIH